ncbi:MAG: hypothetical protein R3234_13570 [Thermoanaerobaculia bacterium]|nr:hypothetical protein [Thermoanaerobaculia bacterium]
MKEIKNTTNRPLRVPLPQGKTLHLGPRHTGEVAASALEHPPFQEMVESGEVEVLGEGDPESRHPFKEETGPAEPSP